MVGQPVDDSSALSPEEWFTQAVGQPCKLVQQQTGTRSSIHKRQKPDPQDSSTEVERQSIGSSHTVNLCQLALPVLLERLMRYSDSLHLYQQGCCISGECKST